VCELMNPSMSSIAMDFHRAGYNAARALDRLMRREAGVPERIVTDVMHVIVRGSTNLGAVPNLHIRRALGFIRDNARRAVTVRDVVSIAGL